MILEYRRSLGKHFSFAPFTIRAYDQLRMECANAAQRPRSYAASVGGIQTE